MPPLLASYKWLTGAIAPLLALWLQIRRLRGKEDSKRLHERFGFATIERPKGTLLWLHAASVGEANSVLPLIRTLITQAPALSLLLTTGTVTSARLMAERLPKQVIHQYAPIDTPQATKRFMRHWLPDIGLIVESELWPNMILAADREQCYLGLINARMSQRSFARWQHHIEAIRSLLSCFNTIFAQTEEDARRLSLLGALRVQSVGNIKYDAEILACDERALVALKTSVGERPLWLAASTHPGEEAMIAKTHKLLAATRPNLLTIIVPRHAARGMEIARALGGNIALRSKQENIRSDTAFYVADTMGELGLFYRLSDIVFMGGSLVKHGGQNPLEAARLACALVSGTHTHNFAEMYTELQSSGGCVCVSNAEALAAEISRLFSHPQIRAERQKIAKQWSENKGGATARLFTNLSSILRVGVS